MLECKFCVCNEVTWILHIAFQIGDNETKKRGQEKERGHKRSVSGKQKTGTG